MTHLTKRFALALAAVVLSLPASAWSSDTVTLIAPSSGSFALIEEPVSVPVSAPVGSESVEQDAAKGPGEVELAALYYYAQQNNTARVDAEATRLRGKYPDFVVPGDLFVPKIARAVDESALWALYENADFTAIDAEIIRRKSETPDWSPSADFTAKLERKKQRVLMTEAASAKNWTAVVQAAGTLDPKTETEVDLLWTLIDAYAALGLKPPLADVYRGILLRDSETAFAQDIVVTTLRKAVRDFPVAEVDAVMTRLAATPQMQLALQPVAMDLLRKTVAEFNSDEARTEPLPEADLARLAAVAGPAQQTADFSLLGWYYLKIKQPAVGTQWFRKALNKTADAENAKGLYLSLAAQNLEAEAYQVAVTHLDKLSLDPEFLMNALSLRFTKPDASEIDEAVVASYSTTILRTMNAEHAEILGWYAYNSKQYEASKAWFGKAIDWKPASPRVKGLALSLLRLEEKDAFADLKTRYGEQFPEIWDEIKVASVPKGRKATSVVKPQGGVEANYQRNFKAKRYSACIADIADLEARGQVSAAARQISGWCHLGLNRLSEARAAFTQGLSAGGTAGGDSAYGLALTLLRGRLTDDAQAVLGMYSLSGARQREIQAEIYVQRARAAYDRKQFARAIDALDARASLVAEPADLSQLRAWSHYNMGNKSVANQIFKRLNGHLQNAEAQRGLSAAGGL